MALSLYNELTKKEKIYYWISSLSASAFILSLPYAAFNNTQDGLIAAGVSTVLSLGSACCMTGSYNKRKGVSAMKINFVPRFLCPQRYDGRDALICTGREMAETEIPGVYRTRFVFVNSSPPFKK